MWSDRKSFADSGRVNYNSRHICVPADSATDSIYFKLIGHRFYLRGNIRVLSEFCWCREKGGFFVEQKALVLCDPEADYAQQMAGFLESGRDFPWTVILCTGVRELEQVFVGASVEVLVIAESLVREALPKYPVKQLVLLNESGCMRFSEVMNIDKYQEADNVKKELLKLYARQREFIYPVLGRSSPAMCVGFYSPVRRCLQTSTAIAYSQLFSEKKRVLYLNFENFAHFSESMGEEAGADLTSLLYYVDAPKEEFALHLRAMRKNLGNWEYIPPMCNGENLAVTEAGDWVKLVAKCRTLKAYDLIVLDLNDSMQGVFEILRQCDRIYTITKTDRAARKKQDRYEYLVKKKMYEDILQKTVQLQIPAMSRLPEELEDYSRGELAEYVRRELISEEENGIHSMEAVSSE